MVETVGSFGEVGSASVAIRARFDRLSADLRRARGDINRQSTQAGRQAGAMFSESFAARARTALAGVAAALGTREVARFADVWTEAGNKIAAASEISGVQADTLEEISEAAIAARADFGAYVDLYARLLRVAPQVSATQREIAAATDIVSKAFKAGGATTQEITAGLTQLGQALGSGVLQGDELRSLRENAPIVAQAIAEEFGTTIAGLKEMGADGELTAERVFRGILKAQDRVEAAFQRTDATIGDAFNNLGTALARFIGQANKSSGASDALVRTLKVLADNLDIAAVAAAALAARAVTPLVAALGAQLATAARTAAAALAAMTTSAGAATVAATALSRVVGILGGPLGLILTLAAGAAAAFVQFGGSTRSAADGIAGLSAAIGETQSRLSELASVEQKLESDTDALKAANERLNDAVASGGEIATATAQADVAAIQRRIAANENLRDAILATIRAQEQSLRAEALVAERAFRREFSPKVETAADIDVITGQGIGEEERTRRQQKALDDLAKSAEAALAAGNISEFQQRFLAARAELLQTKTAADELAQSIGKVLAGESAAGAGTAAGGGTRTGGATRAGGTSETELNAFGEAVARLREANLAAAAEIRAVQDLNPVIDDYAISLRAAAIEQELLAAAQEAGVEASRAQVANLAEATAALEVQAEAARRFGEAAGGIREETAALEDQAEVLRGINPAIEDYGQALETAAAEQELLNLAQAAGIPLTDEMRAAIRQLASDYGAAAAGLSRLEAEQAAFAAGAQDFKDFSRDIMGGFISDLREGKSAVEALADAFGRLGDKFLELALNAVFSPSGAGAGGFLSGFLSPLLGGLLGGIGGGIGGGGGSIGGVSSFGLSTPVSFDEGGRVRGPGTSRSDSIPAMLSNGEFVINAGAAAKHLPFLEAINEGRPVARLAGGGLAGFSGFSLGRDAPEMIAFDRASRAVADDAVREMTSGEAVQQTVFNAPLIGQIVTPDVGGFRRSQPQLAAELRRLLGRGQRQE